MEEKTSKVLDLADAFTRAGNEVAARVSLRKDRTGNKFNLPRSTTLPMLVAMNRLGKNIYPGTVDPVEIQRRREANRRARKARRAFRKSNARKGVR